MARGVLFGQGGVGRADIPLQEKDVILPAIKKGLTAPQDRPQTFGVGRIPSDVTNPVADSAMRGFKIATGSPKSQAPVTPIATPVTGGYPVAPTDDASTPDGTLGRPRATASGVQGWTAKRQPDGSMAPNAYVPPSEADSTRPVYEPAPLTAEQVAKNRGVLKNLSRQWSSDSNMDMTSDAAAQMKGVFRANSIEQSARNSGAVPMNSVARAQARARWDQARDDAYLAALPEKKRREVEAQRAATAMQRIQGTEGYQTKKLESDALVKSAEANGGKMDRRDQLERERMLLESQDRAEDRKLKRGTPEDRFDAAYQAFIKNNPDVDDKTHDNWVERTRRTYGLDKPQAETVPVDANPNPKGNKVSQGNIKPGSLQEKADAGSRRDPTFLKSQIANIEAAISRTTDQNAIARAKTRIAQLTQQLNNG